MKICLATLVVPVVIDLHPLVLLLTRHPRPLHQCHQRFRKRVLSRATSLTGLGRVHPIRVYRVRRWHGPMKIPPYRRRGGRVPQGPPVQGHLPLHRRKPISIANTRLHKRSPNYPVPGSEKLATSPSPSRASVKTPNLQLIKIIFNSPDTSSNAWRRLVVIMPPAFLSIALTVLRSCYRGSLRSLQL